MYVSFYTFKLLEFPAFLFILICILIVISVLIKGVLCIAKFYIDFEKSVYTITMQHV